jgi:hypothetical protein
MTSPLDHSTDRHVSDGVLLALHDDEHGEQLDAGRAHVDHCDDCKARLVEIAGQASRLRESLASIPVPQVSEQSFRRRVAAARARRVVPLWRRPVWQAAAAVVVLTAVAAASPVQQWLRRHLEQPSTTVRTSPPLTTAPTAPTVQSTERSGATVSFAPAGSDFTVRFDSVPDAGVVTVERTAAAEISARVVGGAGTGGDAFVVLPRELGVRNATSSRASYRIALPVTVTRLRVIVAGQQVFDGLVPAVVRLHPPP